MPRKAKVSEQKQKTVPAKVEPQVKARKPYPSPKERLLAAEAQIARLTKLNAERSALIAQTENKLNERKEALAKSEQALANAIAKKNKLTAALESAKAAKHAPAKLSPEERAEKRKEALAKARKVRAEHSQEKKAEKAKMDALMNLLREQGKSVDELIEAIGKNAEA